VNSIGLAREAAFLFGLDFELGRRRLLDVDEILALALDLTLDLDLDLTELLGEVRATAFLGDAEADLVTVVLADFAAA